MAGAFNLIAAALLLAVTATTLAAVLDVQGAAARGLAVFVIGAAVIVGLVELESLIRVLTPTALAVGQTTTAAVAVGVWLGRGRPRLLPPRPGAGTRPEPALAILALAAALALAFQLFIAVAVAPSEPDALGYHLPRAAYWLQYHTALQHSPGQLDDPQLASPPNAEMVLAWSMGLARSDRFTQLVQWLAALAAACGVAAIARELGFARNAALWAALLFALMPAPLLQAATDQNDLFLTALLLGAGLFLVRGVRTGHRGDLLAGSLAFGLAAGTKLTFALALAPLAAVAVCAARRGSPAAGGTAAARLVRAAAMALAATALLGAFNYVQNVRYTHTVTGFSGTPHGDFARSAPVADAARVAWNMVDAPGVAVPAWLGAAANEVSKPLFSGLHGSAVGGHGHPIRRESNEDESAYGLTGLLVLLPLIALGLLARRVAPARRALAAAAAAFFVAYVLTLGYTPEGARYLMPAVAVAAPLLASSHRRPGVRWIVLVLALATVPATLLRDQGRPVVASAGERPVLALDRIGQQTIDSDLAPFAPVLRRLDTIVKRHDAVGFLQQDDIRDYLLFGQPLQRRVVPFDPPQLTVAGLRTAGVRGVIVAYVDRPPCTTPSCLALPVGLMATQLGSDAIWVTAA